MFTLNQFSRMIPANRNPELWYSHAQELFPIYKIDSWLRVAGFMAQCGHESRDFMTLEENLNYSVSALKRVFPRYFRNVNPNDYARNPEKLANYVYMDEFRTSRGAMGNVNPGDGWRFRGRGIKQLTGRNNYTAFGQSIDMSAEDAADYIATPRGAIESACWFWDRNNLNPVADRDDIVRMTNIINGGTIGLTDRENRYNRAKSILLEGRQRDRRMLVRGMKGVDVREMQQALNIYADGDFGRNTENALKNWQRLNGLIPDGRAGNNTYRLLYK